MRKHPFNRFLRSEATEHGGEGGGASTPVSTPAASAENTDPAAGGTPGREPTRLEKIVASIRDKGAILAESADRQKQVSELTTRLAERDGTISTLQERVKTLEAENAALQADFQTIDTAFKESEAKRGTVDKSAARQIAGMGFEPETLPAASGDGATVEALVAKMNATSDPVEKYRLAEQINKLEAAEN